MTAFVLISGCSGGGKSSLLAELARRGHATVEEPGRRIVAAERETGGTALPWVDMAGFARRAVTMARSDLAAAAQTKGPVFFDRGLIDAAVGLERATGAPCRDTLGDQARAYAAVFLAPPWPDIYRRDDDRRHNLSDGIDEYERLQLALHELEYLPLILPKIPVEARADWVLEQLETALDATPPKGAIPAQSR